MPEDKAYELPAFLDNLDGLSESIEIARNLIYLAQVSRDPVEIAHYLDRAERQLGGMTELIGRSCQLE